MGGRGSGRRKATVGAAERRGGRPHVRHISPSVAGSGKSFGHGGWAGTGTKVEAGSKRGGGGAHKHRDIQARLANEAGRHKRSASHRHSARSSPSAAGQVAAGIGTARHHHRRRRKAALGQGRAPRCRRAGCGRGALRGGLRLDGQHGPPPPPPPAPVADASRCHRRRRRSAAAAAQGPGTSTSARQTGGGPTGHGLPPASFATRGGGGRSATASTSPLKKGRDCWWARAQREHTSGGQRDAPLKYYIHLALLAQQEPNGPTDKLRGEVKSWNRNEGELLSLVLDCCGPQIKDEGAARVGALALVHLPLCSVSPTRDGSKRVFPSKYKCGWGRAWPGVGAGPVGGGGGVAARAPPLVQRKLLRWPVLPRPAAHVRRARLVGTWRGVVGWEASPPPTRCAPSSRLPRGPIDRLFR